MKNTFITGLSIYALLIAPIYAQKVDYITVEKAPLGSPDERVLKIESDSNERYTFSVCDSASKDSSCEKIHPKSFSKNELKKKLKKEERFYVLDKTTEGGTFAGITVAGLYATSGLALGPIGAVLVGASFVLAGLGMSSHVKAMNDRFGRSPADHEEVLKILRAIESTESSSIKDLDKSVNVIKEALTEIVEDRSRVAKITGVRVFDGSRQIGKRVPKTAKEKLETIHSVGR